MRVGFRIDGKAVGKARPRFANGRVFTPAGTKAAEGTVADLATDAMLQIPSVAFTGPVRLEMEVIVAIPPSWSKKKRGLAELQGIRPTVKPDIDNHIKLVADAMNGLVYEDDRQIVEVSVSRRYGPEAYTDVIVTTLLGDPT
jgi:Holliday junction resolvase RusA-like endonuclease